jgi:hypothetical protein
VRHGLRPCEVLTFALFILRGTHFYKKKNPKFLQNKIIQYLDWTNFIQKKIQLISKKEHMKYIRNYNKGNKQSKYITKIIQTHERYNKNKHI